MRSVKIVVLEQEGGWPGYLADCPDYHTQETIPRLFRQP